MSSTPIDKIHKKVSFQLWTDGMGSFGVKRDQEDSQFEYLDPLLKKESYLKLIDSKIYYNNSITQELVQDWIEELKQEDVLDQDGNLIYL